MVLKIGSELQNDRSIHITTVAPLPPQTIEHSGVCARIRRWAELTLGMLREGRQAVPACPD